MFRKVFYNNLCIVKSVFNSIFRDHKKLSLLLLYYRGTVEGPLRKMFTVESVLRNISRGTCSFPRFYTLCIKNEVVCNFLIFFLFLVPSLVPFFLFLVNFGFDIFHIQDDMTYCDDKNDFL